MSDSSTPKDTPKDEKGPSATKPEAQSQGEGQPPQPKKKKAPPIYKRPALMALIVAAVIAGVVGGLLFWRHSRDNEESDDAYIDVVAEQASPQIAGRVIRVDVNDNQDVKSGQVLVELDPADYEARLEQGRASRAQADAQRQQAVAQKSVFEAQAEEARANLVTAQANESNARRQWERVQRLKGVNAGAVSAEQVDNAQTASTNAGAQVNAAEKAVSAAQAQLGYADSLVAAAEAAGRSADATVREAELTLSNTKVCAHVDGRVSSRTVSAGNIVAAGTPLMAIVPKAVYITANFKETQLDHMRAGQPVRIKVDAYPELTLTGRVDSVEAASGQAFSAIPAQNATGNWVKVVQRVPVKIVFDQLPQDPAIRLGPGMSVEVSVMVR